MGNVLTQFFFIPTAPLTEKNCPDQTGRVFFVTGGYAGVGFELCKILYARNATVCIAGRSDSKAEKALSDIRKSSPTSAGRLRYVSLDLADLSTIKPAVDDFVATEGRLDVLINNAGVMYPPAGSTDAQGNELQVGTNCLGPYLLYRMLLPILSKTASAGASPAGSVRVIWAASIAVHVAAPHPQGMVLGEDGRPSDLGPKANYAQTKVGNVFLARECAKTTPQTGVLHAAFNPGNLRTELQRHWSGLDHWFTDKVVLYTAIHGAYTELWAALTPELSVEDSGAYVFPWGRLGSLPQGVEDAIERSGVASKFVAWCDSQTNVFM
ncbi:putative NAD -binding protein [Rosellinia necatrix]|uniref:Putative NAD-binding protein n=1 Tax=Rosellinia necatrix TaxID=77044 RepID=A0A1W2TIG5_ROSNE|nr:putative NAD -binding protein [Rosellinia necatrix]